MNSKKGEGTSFTIHFPASVKIPIKEEPEGQEIVYGNETILLVDDEKIVLETTEKLLNYLGYSVIKAQGGREAIDIFRANRDVIDVVILDLVMPELGGGPVLDALVEIKKDVKVILTS